MRHAGGFVPARDLGTIRLTTLLDALDADGDDLVPRAASRADTVTRELLSRMRDVLSGGDGDPTLDELVNACDEPSRDKNAPVGAGAQRGTAA